MSYQSTVDSISAVVSRAKGALIVCVVLDSGDSDQMATITNAPTAELAQCMLVETAKKVTNPDQVIRPGRG